MLSVHDLCVSYDGSPVLRGVTLSVGEGDMVLLTGPNSAGKSTTLRAISGLLAPTSGEIRFAARSITGLPPHTIARLGIAHASSDHRVFPFLSVVENLRVGFLNGYSEARGRMVSSPALRGSAGSEWDRALDGILQEFPFLRERHRQMAGTLSGGEQQILSIARSLIAEPRLLLLDEPLLGLAPRAVDQIMQIIVDINRRGISVLMVEENLRRARGIAKRVYVLEGGIITGESIADEVS